ncbi:MAG: hypothetical protein R6V17_00100 [Halanaerobacter sp.]
MFVQYGLMPPEMAIEKYYEEQRRLELEYQAREEEAVSLEAESEEEATESYQGGDESISKEETVDIDIPF